MAKQRCLQRISIENICGRGACQGHTPGLSNHNKKILHLFVMPCQVIGCKLQSRLSAKCLLLLLPPLKAKCTRCARKLVFIPSRVISLLLHQSSRGPKTSSACRHCRPEIVCVYRKFLRGGVKICLERPLTVQIVFEHPQSFSTVWKV